MEMVNLYDPETKAITAIPEAELFALLYLISAPT